MSEIERLRALLAALTEDCTPGPWHGVTSGSRANWWLDNPAGDSSFPNPDDVAAMLNALPALLDVAEAARELLVEAEIIRSHARPLKPHPDTVSVLRAALNRLDGAS